MARPRSDTRDRLVAAMAALLRRQGYHGTGMAQVVAESGAPRGSVYFLFPGGKEELAVAAIEAAASEFASRLRTAAAAPEPAGFLAALVAHFAESLEESDFHSGCPITTVTLEVAPDAPAVTAACRRAYDLWVKVTREALCGYGIAEAEAEDLAVLGLSAIEGALALCRAAGDVTALRTVERRLVATLTRAAAT